MNAGRWRVVVALGLLELMMGLDIPVAFTASVLEDDESDMLVVVVAVETNRSGLPKASSSWLEAEIHGCHLEFRFGTPALANLDIMIPSIRANIHFISYEVQ